MYASPSFFPVGYGSVDYGDLSADMTAWLTANANQLVVDDSGYTFLVFGPAANRIQLVYMPTGKQPTGDVWKRSIFKLDTKAGQNVVRNLMRKGRLVTAEEVEKLKAGQPIVAPKKPASRGGAPRGAKAPPLATKGTGTKMRRGPSESEAPPLTQRSWFPFLIAGGVLAALAAGIIIYRRRQAAATKKAK